VLRLARGPRGLQQLGRQQLQRMSTCLSALCQVVYNSCFTFPEKLIFFLLGTFQVRAAG
jgi:hypothetical protein